MEWYGDFYKETQGLFAVKTAPPWEMNIEELNPAELFATKDQAEGMPSYEREKVYNRLHHLSRIHEAMRIDRTRWYKR